ncbi:MAG: OmpA family protein [Endozoicomonas sp.]
MDVISQSLERARHSVVSPLKTVFIVLLLALSAGCSLPHIGSYVVEDGTAPDADQDRVPDDQDRCNRTPLGTPVDIHGCSDDDDNDKVANGRDQCPRTPPGTTVDAFGCSVDTDGDGVLDSRDKCPGTPPNTPVDGDGCTLDADLDGVKDYKDRCKGTPLGAPVDRWGCSNQPATPSGGYCSDLCQRLPVLSDVHFKLDQATLRPEAYALLNEVVRILKEEKMSFIQVVGHADSSGTDDYNLKLSENRAQTVMDYLIGHGVSEKRLAAIGRGEEQPVASNSTDRGRAMNRRVVFEVRQPGDLPQARYRDWLWQQ